jgi:hypothetical protein
MSPFEVQLAINRKVTLVASLVRMQNILHESYSPGQYITLQVHAAATFYFRIIKSLLLAFMHASFLL